MLPLLQLCCTVYHSVAYPGVKQAGADRWAMTIVLGSIAVARSHSGRLSPYVHYGHARSKHRTQLAKASFDGTSRYHRCLFDLARPEPQLDIAGETRNIKKLCIGHAEVSMEHTFSRIGNLAWGSISISYWRFLDRRPLLRVVLFFARCRRRRWSP